MARFADRAGPEGMFSAVLAPAVNLRSLATRESSLAWLDCNPKVDVAADSEPLPRSAWEFVIETGAGEDRFLFRGVSWLDVRFCFEAGGSNVSRGEREVQWRLFFDDVSEARVAVLSCDFGAYLGEGMDSMARDGSPESRLRGVFPYVIGLFCPLVMPVPWLFESCFDAIVSKVKGGRRLPRCEGLERVRSTYAICANQLLAIESTRARLHTAEWGQLYVQGTNKVGG